jgi:hypothetical protein
MDRAVIRFVARGVHQRLESALCGSCPQGVTGCCAAPPVIAWADLGRIVTLGGRDWLLSELTAGRLYPCPRGLAMKRVDNPDVASTGREKKCVYHGERGCTIPHDRRSATCNYYVCDDALADDEHAREVRERLTTDYGAWDLALAERVGEPTWDAAFLDRLGEEFRALTTKSKHARRR